MKKTTALSLALLMVILISSGSAQTIKNIKLKDGSTLKGSVLELKDGYYTIETSSLGQMVVPQEDIINIASPEAAVSKEGLNSFDNPKLNASKGNVWEKVNQAQNTMMSDPELQEDVKKLVQDPEVMSILSDPEFMNDALSMDPERMKNNPKSGILLNNPGIQAIINKMIEK